MSPNKLFENQLKIIQKALTNNCIIMGDFNLDARMEGVNSYNLKTFCVTLPNLLLTTSFTN